MDINQYRDDLDVLGLSSKADQYKLTGLYAYNALFDADEEYVDQVNDGLTIGTQSPIAGIYLNQKQEEDTIEILIPYFPNGGSGFKKEDICVLLGKAVNALRDIKAYHRFVSIQPRAGEILREYLLPSEKDAMIPPLWLHVITNADTSEKEKFEIQKAVAQYDTSIKGIKDINATIDFGEDIQGEIENNRAPYDYVKEGELSIDNPKNCLRYSSDSVVYNVSALSLKELWQKEGKRGLLAMNLRYYIKNASIDDRIENSILNDADNFWYLNNGIIIVCDDFAVKGDTLIMKKFSIVNGGQTTRMIGSIPFEKDFYLLAKIIRNKEQSISEKNLFVSKVAEASNTQKPIKAKDIIANKVEQRNLKSMLAEHYIFIEIKRGEKCDKTLYKEPWQRTKNNELAQDLFAFVYLQPGPARNNVSKILMDQNKYRTIFDTHSYDPGFLRSMLFLEKAYRDYSKYIGKTTDATADPMKKGLVKNGMFYTLATIGYLMKLAYNPSFVDAVRRYKGSTNTLDFYTSEQAFNFAFISEEKKYKEFALSARDLFDTIVAYCIKPEFQSARLNRPSLVYSDWMKTNTGFASIRDRIDFGFFESDDNRYINQIYKFFGKISDEEIDKNRKLYEENCAKNRSVTAKSSSGEELSERDAALRNELMKYRLEYSQVKHIAERMVFTDRMLELIVQKKPMDLDALGKIIGPKTAHYIGPELLSVIFKYI